MRNLNCGKPQTPILVPTEFNYKELGAFFGYSPKTVSSDIVSFLINQGYRVERVRKGTYKVYPKDESAKVTSGYKVL